MCSTVSFTAARVSAAHEGVLREHGYHALRVKDVVQESDDTRSFVLDVPDELGDVFRYRPGQFCTFRVRVGDSELMRCYSMSSAPTTDPDLTVTVKRVAGGAVSNWLNDHVSAGDVLEVTKPAGVFCPSDRAVPVVAFCGGSVARTLDHQARPRGDAAPRKGPLREPQPRLGHLRARARRAGGAPP